MTTNPRGIDASLADLESEHRGLADFVGRLRSWWNECREIGRPRFGEMGQHVGDLADRVAEHFALEEAGGYLNAVCETSPDHRSPVLALERQHDELLSGLRSLSERLRRSDPPFEHWSDAGAEFEAIIARLAEHERAETELIEHVAAIGSGAERRTSEPTGVPR